MVKKELIDYGKANKDCFLPKAFGQYDYKENDALKYKARMKGNIKDLYFMAKEKGYTDVDFKTFKEVIQLTNLSIVESITKTGIFFRLPFNCGLIGITKFMPRYYKYFPSRDDKDVEGAQNNLRNTHTDGYVAKLTWVRKGYVENAPLMMRAQSSTLLRQHIFKSIMNENSMDNYMYIKRGDEDSHYKNTNVD